MTSKKGARSRKAAKPGRRSEKEWERLRARLEEAEATLDAIRSGEVDAIVVSGPRGERAYTLEGADHPFRILVETMAEGALTLAPDGTIVYANARFAQLARTTLDRVLARSIHDFVDETDRPSIQRLVKEPTAGVSLEIPILAVDGTRVPALVASGSFLVREGDSVPHVCLIVTDISELTRTALELERSNAELREFAYVASHDIQEPLRAIGTSVHMLLEDDKLSLDAGQRLLLERAAAGTSRMHELVRALLEYSSADKGGSGQIVDTKKAVADVLESLDVAIREARAKIRVGDLPAIHGDPVHLPRVFQNLVQNAIKFTAPGAPPRIEIDARREGRAWHFSVKDEGLGIDPVDVPRLFTIFTRLDPRGRHPGTGMGLALCKKIVERHGGRIWVESQGRGKGSVFRFTIPDEDPASRGP
ncbi:MAG TPA: ATP-binding protein [Candidatus Thermoplasmatota archaeon]|nr:ATP-binding protein [Candidatus Thermoplasmatota archaeon]